MMKIVNWCIFARIGQLFINIDIFI